MIERVGEIAAREGIVLHELRRREATLEEAFLRITGGETERISGRRPPSSPPIPPPPEAPSWPA